MNSGLDAAYTEEVGWNQEFDGLFARIGKRFVRREMQSRAKEYVKGLLSPAERKNGWQLSEAVERSEPYSIQHLLDRARWDADLVRDDLQAYAVDELGCKDGVLVVDETGFLKKGTHSAGVNRQYSGTAGRVENCQIGVFLAYAARGSRVLIDRELYLPRQWADDAPRRAAAKVPESVGFATKPQLARQMIARAIAAKMPFSWITGDAVYGDDRSLRIWLEQQDLHFVLSVAGNQYVWTPAMRQTTVKQLAQSVEADHWQDLSAGDGAKGPRLYAWARIALLSWQMPGQRWLLLRRSLSEPTHVTYYLCYCPAQTDLQTMARVAGTRWAIEECFEAAKGQVGLDHYEVRSWHGWYRHMTLARVAHAYLTVLRAHAIALPVSKKKSRQSLMQQWKQLHMHSCH